MTNTFTPGTMVEYTLEKMPYVFMPYESRLARLEAEKVLGSQPSMVKSRRLVFRKHKYVPHIVDRLTYFRSVTIRTNTFQHTHLTRQALIESLDTLAKRRKKDVCLDSETVPCKWQARRYFSHGIHEYIGKYHPQIVKFIFNLLDLGSGNAVIDPFCGCGTTLVEAYVNGYRFLGVDANPLAVWIARTKIEALCSDIGILESEYASLVARARQLGKSDIIPDANFISEKNLRYLRSWFTESTLSKLLTLSNEISKVEHECARDLFNVSLSNILREVSLQEPGQLRIRRRKCPPDLDVFELFFSNLRRSLDSIKVFYELNLQGRVRSDAERDIIAGDSRHLVDLTTRRDFDAAVFSPPYATALPYIDTDRLSLIYFGLTHPSSLRTMGRSMIGDREIAGSERQRIDNIIEDGLVCIPDQAKRIIRMIYAKNKKANVGFRRKNTAALLHKYLIDMREALASIHEVLKPSGACAFVVGNNTTIAGGTKVIIPTAKLLALIGRDIGFNHVKTLTLNTFPRTNVHCKNSVQEEYLVVLSKWHQGP